MAVCSVANLTGDRLVVKAEPKPHDAHVELVDAGHVVEDLAPQDAQQPELLLHCLQHLEVRRTVGHHRLLARTQRPEMTVLGFFGFLTLPH